MNKTAWHNLFYSPNESRLRAGWRLIIQLAMLGFLLLFEILAFALANAFFHWKISDTGLFVLSTIFELVAFTASVALVRRFLDKRSFVSLGLQVGTMSRPCVRPSRWARLSHGPPLSSTSIHT